MTLSLSIERALLQEDSLAASAPAAHLVEAFDLAGLAGDAMARGDDDGRRRVLACPGLPKAATPVQCVAAWHALLHWLRYRDEPSATALVGRQAHTAWPIVTRADAQTSLGDLKAAVEAQWPCGHEAWPDLRDPAHAGLQEAVRCQAVQLQPGDDAPSPELVLQRAADGGWQLACAASRYGEDFQRTLLALWHRFVTVMAARPQALLSDAALADGLDGSGIVGPQVPMDGSLLQRFDDAVRTAPGRTAVVDDEGRIGYAALDALAEAWAEALRAAGVRHGDHVGLAFARNRGRHMVAAQLAVLKAGAAFVPLDASQPATRLQCMAEDADMRLALADTACGDALRLALPAVHCLDAGTLSERPAAPHAAAHVPLDATAYVIFTSGSTGQPKGVKVSHGNLLNFVAHMSAYIDAGDVLSQFAPFTFDASVAEIHASVLNAATLVILGSALIDDPERLQARMTAEGVTFAAFPPQYAQHLSPEGLPTLRTLLTAGSAPDHALIARWQPRVRYLNGYGPTETTILSTAWQPGHVPAPHEPIAIGEPISNTEVRVANRFGHALPHGIVGELVIGGEGVAHGYLKRDALTRERFMTIAGTRWYRSGDLACLDAEGRLVFAGRVDSQIKLRGHRLEPGEVEAALLSVAGVRQAAVALGGDGASRQLVAFCCGEPLGESDIRRQLSQRLPAWALPNRFVWIDRLPLTRNGKTDYARLLADVGRQDAQADAPSIEEYADPLEARVAAIWSEVLQRRPVGPEDHFIHLGGDSLTALVVASAVRRLGYALPASALLQHPRLADYVQRLQAQGLSAAADDHADWQGSAALAPIQGWFFSLGLAHPGRFCQTLAFDSDERVDAGRLAQACVALARHHDQLRARFEPDGAGGWRQCIDAAPLVLPAPSVIEIADGLIDATGEAYGRRLADELRIDQAPLFRLAVIHSPRRSRVVWVLHHLIVDTVSHGLLLDDLQQLYRAPGQEAREVLPGKSQAFGAWSDALLRDVEADAAAALAPWLPVLAEVSSAPALPLRAARTEGAPEVVCEARLTPAQTRRFLEQATRCYRQSPEELVLAATCRALAQVFGLDRVAIDIEWHGREASAGVERTVGWFTSVHPMAISVAPGEPLGPWLMALKEARAAIPKRGREFYALRYLSRDPQVRAAFNGYRAPQVLFNFSGIVQRSAEGWRSVPVTVLETGDGNANPYALSVETTLCDGELAVACHSCAALWEGDAAQRLGHALTQALLALAQHCSDAANRRWTPSDFPLLALTQAQADTLPPDARTAFPLTDMQETMWRHHETYQVVMAYRMPRRFDAHAWERAVGEWIARHDCLRSFVHVLDDGNACQVVLESLAPPLEVHHTEPGRSRALADELVERARRAPVVVERAPLFGLQAVHDGGDAFVAVLSIHHLIHDGWSIELLLGDLFDTYRRLGGETVPRPAAPLASLADVVAQQRRLRDSAELRAHWAALPWAGGACRLPVTVREDGTSAGGTAQLRRDMRLHLDRLDDGLVRRVRERAHALGVTVNSLWLTGYAALLRCLGGTPQVRCGVIQSGRSDEIAGIETLTGCCVNTLPLVLQMTPAQTLAQTAGQVDAQLGRMRAAPAYPLSAIQAQVRPQLDGDEIFSTLFNIESHAYGRTAGGDRPVLLGGFESTNHDLIFGLIEQAGDAPGALRYGVRIGYDASRHDAASVAGWLALYEHLMALLTTQAEQPWEALPLLPQAMHDQLVVDWNRTEHPYRDDACIHELVAEQAARTPDATALVYESATLTYRELDDRANRLARHLQALGVGPETVVGCCFERSTEMVVALLGVLKAGGAYVPLDPELPAQRLAAMVADVGLRLVLTHGALPQGPLGALSPAVRLVRLDADAATIGAHAAHAVLSGNCPRDLAYVIFTSGSTGKPKAAMNEHGALVNRLQWMQHAYPIGAADRVLQKTPFSFDVSVWEFFWPLITGATLVLARPGGHRDPAYLGALIRSQRITTLHFVPSMLEAFIDGGDLAGCTSVRQVIASGEALPGTLAARFRALSKAALHNLYGPTEAAIDVSHYTVMRSGAGTEPIGRPIWNTRLYVLDERLRPVPVGVCGELYIGGLAVGRGYLGQPELTAQRFIGSPFVAGERLYRTGDLARWRADGEIEYLGRTDHQVKIRGLRIELGEIEHALASHPSVRQAVVTVREDGGRKQLAAYLLAGPSAGDRDALVAALREGLQATLPDYMVPSAFVVLDELPLNANGKVDRARLPAPAAAPAGAVVAPQTAHERALLAIWQEVLGIERIGVTDGFFALGGDSIVAIQIASRALKQGLALQPRHVIEDKTIRRLATRLAPAVDAALAGLDAAQLAALRGAHPALESVYPCTGMQQAMLLHSAREPQQGLYISQLRLVLDGVDPARLQSAWETLVQRHAVLRTAFADVGGERLQQLVMASVALPWRELDLRLDPAALDACLEDERLRPFAADQAPLMRLLLVRTGDTTHVLAWSYHHALIDGWSMGTLMKELAQAYASQQAVRAAPAAPAYRDYIAWLGAQDSAAAAAYWRAHFAGVALGAAAELPAEVLRPAPGDRAAADPREQRLVSIALPAPLTARLQRMARGEGVGAATVMLAAWGLLMSKYNGQAQVLFGYASSGRPHALPDVEHTAGVFINSLPLCLDVDGERTLGQWLAEIQRVQLDHEDHGFLPLADIQRAAGASPAQPLFDSLVVVENFPLDRAALAGQGAQALRVLDVQGSGRDGFGLTLVVYPGESLRLDLVYQPAKVGDAAAATLLERLGRLLAGFADGGDRPLGGLPMLSAEERARALGPWNDTGRAYPSTASVTALFDAQAAVRGEAPALVAADATWSYAELSRRAAAIAGWLQAQGVRRGDRVALSMEKEPALIAAMLAILRCGAAYVPVAVDCPPQRRAFIAADAGIRHAVTRAAYAEQIELPGVAVLSIEDAPDAPPHGVPADAADAEATAYVIYTSGTTGTPKGVAVSHRSLVNFCTWATDAARCGPGERVTQFAPYTFDASAGEIFGTLICGAELHLLPGALIQDPRALTQYLCEHGIRFAAFPPSYAQHIDPTAVPPALSLLTAGSAPTPELVQRWGSRRRYINGYGPTETTILSSAWVCEPGAIDGRGLSIGRPIANTAMYVVDALGQLLPPGLVGEIWIGGDGVAQGYVNRPELNARQFIADPFRPGGRVYRTGDLGRWRDDGCIEFVGRRDRQVKLRGFRIELGEIEARLAEHPEVAEAVAAVRGEGEAQQLVAWIVPSSGQPAGRADALRAFLRLTLPEYMLPQAFVELEHMPLSVNGKIDEKALPAPAPDAAAGDARIAPRTPAEARVAQVWAAVLKLAPEAIGAQSNFFELGGHSLLAMRVAARLLDEHGIDIGVADVFAHPVLAELAACLERQAPGTLPGIEPAPRDGGLPLSFAQRRLWFLDQIEGASQAYQVPGLLRLRGRLDETALRAALQRLVQRHEVLRTTFDAAGGEPTQHVGPAEKPFALQVHDVAGHSDPEAAMRALVAEALDQPFDLAHGPLIRGTLVRVGADDHVLLIAMHHIATDGWSLALLLQELAALYGAFAAGAADPLPPLPLQYADYAHWQQQWLGGALWQSQCAHWQQALAGVPPLLDLPTDRPRPARQDYAGATLAFELDAATRDGLAALGRRHGTTLFMTFLAAWSVVLSRLAGQQDLVVGTPVANRTRLETEPMVGFFVNLLALRLDLSGTPTLAQLLQRVRERVLDGQRHQQLPFEQVVELVQPPRSLAHTPLFQVMLNWQERSLEGFALPGLETAALRPEVRQSKYDLTLDVGEEAGGIVGTFEYATALFDEATIRRHAGYLRRVIAAMLADIEQPAEAVDLLDDEEKRLLASFNDTGRPELTARCWQALFDEQAARTPERVAVRCDGASLSYAELQRRAARRASRLAAHGAGPGEVVALLGERGIELLVSVVAVLKTGAAYLPLDPAHPPQRWLEVLQQARPRLLWCGEGMAAHAAWLRGHWEAERVVDAAQLQPSGHDGDEGFAARRAPAPDDLAYVLFTSGSTGQPKGVQIEQRGMVNNILAKVQPLGLGAHDVIAQTASQCFDISVWQLLGALVLGARVLIVRDDLTRNPPALLAHLADEGVTVWEPVPSVMQAALDTPQALPSLRWVMPTGEALSRELVARWFQHHPATPLMNAYGPAECSDDVALEPIHGPVERVLIGRPVANARLHVLDARLQQQPLGAVGELAVSGPVVGRGYVDREADTAAAFRANPHAAGADDQRLYLTGDLVRRWPDGRLEYVGRKDFQVKLRGFRIELGEIETCLLAHPAVREAVAAVRERDGGEPRLVAWVVAAPGTGVRELDAHLAARLPEYMQPSAIVRLDAMPVNANGKLDRRSLPEAGEGDHVRAAYEAPRTDTERALAGVWEALLQVPHVGRGDSFFDLGGSSLMLVRMLARLKSLGFELGLTEVYQLRTLAGCAEAIDARRAAAAAWPLGSAWRHRIVALGDGRGVLLLDRAEQPRHRTLQALLAEVPAAEQPRFVRYGDDVAALAREVEARGAAALPDADGHAGAAHDPVAALRRQLRARATALEAAPVEAVAPYSPIQRNLMGWQRRDSLESIAVPGWYTPAELQQAFAAVTAEQDMLRAVPGAEPAQWCLLDAAAAAAAPVPVIDLRGHPAADHDGLMRRLGDVLLAERPRSALPCAPVIVSFDDLDHRVLLAVDHLAWDGLSAEALRRRLQHHLAGCAAAPAQRYREHAAEAWRAPDAAAAEALEALVDRAALAEAMRQTRRALAVRDAQPLRCVRLRLPLDGAAGTPAEQAFAVFRRCLRQLTGLERHGVLLNHHGRQAGGRAWFDVVGPFLDKVPFVVEGDTPLEPLVAQLGRFQALGVHFLGLAQALGSAWAETLPPLADEVLFNFLGETAPAETVPDEAALLERLEGFRGLLFEAVAAGDALELQCVLRASAAQAEVLRKALSGETDADGADTAAADAPAWSLEVRDVRKRYGDFEAVRGVSFQVRQGCCFGILGPNGAGKTSLLAMIEGLVPISAGSIRLLGRDVATEIEHIQPRLGVQLQQNNYFQFLTVAELLRFYQDLRAAVGGRREARPVAPLLERLNLQDKLHAKVDELSGGQKQRLSIAIALLEDPDVIFLDEPTSALDPHSRIATWEFIEELKRDPRKTIILTTHYMEEAERLCDEILLMDKGRVIAQGGPSQLIRQLAARQTLHFEFGRGAFPPALLQALRQTHEAEWDARTGRLTLSTANVTDATREVLAMSQAQGLALVNIEINRPTLEQVFLSRTGKELNP